MIKQIFAGAALVLCGATAHASERIYEWTYRGFISSDTDAWTDTTVSGKFTVADANADGIYDLSEVKSFDYGETDESTCGTRSIVCTLSAFSFDPGGDLSFDYEVKESWGPLSAKGQFIRTGQHWGWYLSYPDDGAMSVYGWDPKTVGTITQVPEPHSYLMLGIGLLGLTFGARRNAARRRGSLNGAMQVTST